MNMSLLLLQVHDFRCPDEYQVEVVNKSALQLSPELVQFLLRAVPLVTAAAEDAQRSMPHRVTQQPPGPEHLWVRARPPPGQPPSQASFMLAHCAILACICVQQSIEGTPFEVQVGLDSQCVSVCWLHIVRNLVSRVQVRKVVLLGTDGWVAFDFRNTQRAHFCAWRGNAHSSNFCSVYADFWHGVFTWKCWDPRCEAQWCAQWKDTRDYHFVLPDALQGQRHLFEAPPPPEDCRLEDMLVFADGSRHAVCAPLGASEQAEVQTTAGDSEVEDLLYFADGSGAQHDEIVADGWAEFG
jgi:hypothetical protein